METNGRNIPAVDKFEEALPSPRFDEQTEAAARPVVPLGSIHGSSRTIRRVRNLRPQVVLPALAISVVVGIAAILIYRNASTNQSSATTPTVSETIIKAVPEPASLSPSIQPARTTVSDARATPQREVEPQTVLTVRDEPVKRELKEADGLDGDEEKINERARKEESKRLKRQRKEAEKLAEHTRDYGKGDEPKARLVGVYTVRRKHR